MNLDNLAAILEAHEKWLRGEYGGSYANLSDWLWRNREWANTRQKFKALERDWRASC